MSYKPRIQDYKCDCGQPAVRKKQSMYVCQRCSDLEERQTAWINRKSKVGEQEPRGIGCQLSKYFESPEEPPICGESLKLLKI